MQQQLTSKSAFSSALSVVGFVIVASMVREKGCLRGFDLFLMGAVSSAITLILKMQIFSRVIDI